MITKQFNSYLQKILGHLLIAVLFISAGKSYAQHKTIDVANFNKVIVSPHIAVTFIAAESESVVIESIDEPMEKMNVEVEGNTLRLYLDGAKMVTKSERVNRDEWHGKRSLYNGTVATVTVNYKNLEELSLRGEETFVCQSPLTSDKFRLKIYGESQVYLHNVALGSLQTTIYGESYLELKEGSIERQKITAYGETKVNTLGVQSTSAKITAYGEGSYRLHVTDRLKVTAYGEATVAYEGNPEVDKGIVIGEATIQKIY